MSKFSAKAFITPKPEVNDPQGNAVLGGLRSLGFGDVSNVRVGKYLTLELDAPDQAAAEQAAKSMCDKLLANPVIESYQVEVSALER